MKKLLSILFLVLGGLSLNLFPAETYGQEPLVTNIAIAPNPVLINQPTAITVTVSNALTAFKYIYIIVDASIKEAYDCSAPAPVKSCTKTFTKTFDEIGGYVISAGLKDPTGTPIRVGLNFFTPVQLIVTDASGNVPAPNPQVGVPSISDLSPESGRSGTILTIAGQNFDCSIASTYSAYFSQNNVKLSSSLNKKSVGDGCSLETVVPFSDKFTADSNLSVTVAAFMGAESNPLSFLLLPQPSQSSTIPPPPVSGSSGGSGASMKRSCENEPTLTIKNPSLYQATGTKEWTTIGYDGLVPCGKCVVVSSLSLKQAKDEIKKPGNSLSGAPKYVSCQFCHFFVMFGGIVNFLLLKIAIPAAILLLVIGGAMFVFAAGNPGTIKKGIDIMKSVAIGLVIMFTAWIVVSTILTLVGVASWTGLRQGWFGINCPINI